MKWVKFYKWILEGYISKGYIDCPIRRETVKIVRATEVYNLQFVAHRFANIINLWIIVQESTSDRVNVTWVFDSWPLLYS